MSKSEVVSPKELRLVTAYFIRSLRSSKVYRSADEYLHYSNGIILSMANAETAISMILLAAYHYRLLMLLLTAGSPDIQTKPHQSKPLANADVFDGVIEHYCGTPP